MRTPPAFSLDILPLAIQLIEQELLPKASPRRQKFYKLAMRILEKAQRDLERRRERGELSLQNGPIVSFKNREERLAWGQGLRTLRLQAGLTRVKLAMLAGVSESTIRNLELGRHQPTQAVQRRLQAVRLLGLRLIGTHKLHYGSRKPKAL